MEKGINLQIEEYKNSIIEIINKSNMPISISKLVLFGIYNDIIAYTNKAIDDEGKAYKDSLEVKEVKK